MSDKIRIGLIYGGKSGEHDVSLQTALAVIKAIDMSKYEIVPFYITKQGEWRSGPQLQSPPENLVELVFEQTSDLNEGSAIQPIFNSLQFASLQSAELKEASIN